MESNERLTLQTKAFIADLLAGVNIDDSIQDILRYTMKEVGMFTRSDMVCIYEAGKFLFGIEGTTGRMTDGTTTFTTTEIKNEVDAKQKAITISTSEPTASDGVDGDIWMVYE